MAAGSGGAQCLFLTVVSVYAPTLEHLDILRRILSPRASETVNIPRDICTIGDNAILIVF